VTAVRRVATRATFTDKEVRRVERLLADHATLLVTLDGHIDLTIKPASYRLAVERALAPLGAEVAWATPGARYGVLRRAVRFLVDGERLSYVEMMEANDDDEAVALWLRNAEVGDTFASGTGATIVHCVEV